MDIEPYPDEMFEEAARRESALKAVEKLYDENGDALQQLADIERKEITEDQRIKAIQTAVSGISKYSDALKELAKSEKEELKQQLEDLKKENFQNLANLCMEEYTEKYGERPEDEYWVYMVADYGATGEGETRCLMVTQAMPSKEEDFGDEPYDYTPKTTKEYRAVRKFHETFGTFMLYGLKFLSKEAFFTECAYYLPPVMMKLSNAKCSKEFYTEVHYNFS